MRLTTLRPLAAATLLAFAAQASNAQVLINEIEPNPAGGDPDTQSLELLGTPGEMFSGVLLNVESDPGGSNPGDINGFEAVSGTFDANGLLTVTIDDLENPAFTLVLVDSFTGDTDTDLDADDDGVPDDLSTVGNVFDAIGVPDDADNDVLLYGADLGGADLAFNGQFEPLLVFRDPNTGELFNTVTIDFGEPTERIGIFSAAGDELDPGLFTSDPLAPTFGAANPSVIPEPGSVVLVLLGGALTGAVRMRRVLG